MTYYKRGGLHFIRIWHFGFTFYWTKRKPVLWNEYRPEHLVDGSLAEFNRYIAGDRP